VLANREHFKSCSLREVESMFAPLGVDPERFYFDDKARVEQRLALGIDGTRPVVIMSGKLHAYKRVIDAVRACRAVGVRLVLVGTMADDVRRELGTLPAGDEIVLPQANAEQLRALYCTADIVLFTTFTLSYWEAHATGAKLLVPDTEFSRMVFEDEPGVMRFGAPGMFKVEDEEYAEGVDVASHLEAGLRSLLAASDHGEPRGSRVRFSSKQQALSLAQVYGRLLGVPQTAE
jgi:glycosyltransferase involved in cell wall biosynthesis